MNPNSIKIINYHEETKHAPYGYARSPGYMDWDNQPKPFRYYESTNLLRLPLMEKNKKTPYEQLFKRDKNIFCDFSLQNVAAFLELSLGLSAWKSFQEVSWALRINPSSGNLHPTEAHIILPPLPENCNLAGVFHYDPYNHGLESRAEFGTSIWEKIIKHFKTDGFLIGLSSIFWRESWKYGERAFRYCNHDIGHAMACLSFSANLQGWKITYLNRVADENIETLFGLDKTKWFEFEKEHPDNIFLVSPNNETSIPTSIPAEILDEFKQIEFKGNPNHLSKEHVDWALIEEAALCTRKPETEENKANNIYGDYDFLKTPNHSNNAIEIIRQRRSGQSYDGKTSITMDNFFTMMDKTVPRNGCAPFDLELGETSIHLLLFVHRVVDMDRGLYFLVRNKNDFEDIKSKCHEQFLWEKVTNAPDCLPLYLLKRCDYGYESQTISCNQEIAGDGVFSLGMIAKFKDNVEKAPHLYRHLFWESGMIGQILYLEAEVNSMQGTGIGCFYDDMVHQLLGLNDNSYQSIYHFTMGGAVNDDRLTTLPPYRHLDDS